MKKVGIMTYHRANNVGAVLQNQALQYLLKDYCDIETIEYKNEVIEKSNRIFAFRSVKDQIKIILQLFSFIKRENRFYKYRKKYLKLSKCQYNRNTIEKANLEYDYFITGSDQVWNTKLNGHDFSYFLDFVADGKKRIAYAASFGRTNLLNNEMERICSELGKYEMISVRENEAKLMLEQFGIVSSLVLDPTLLLSGEKWKKILDLSEKNKKKKYVLVYMVANTPELINVAQKYANQNSLEIYVMHYGYKKIKGVFNIRSAPPREFAQYILNADMVFCSSFHAICFSILFQKNFVYALDKRKENNNSRIESLSKILFLDSRKLENVKFDENIDYVLVNEKLEKYRMNSIKKLLESVK